MNVAARTALGIVVAGTGAGVASALDERSKPLGSSFILGSLGAAASVFAGLSIAKPRLPGAAAVVMAGIAGSAIGSRIGAAHATTGAREGVRVLAPGQLHGGTVRTAPYRPEEQGAVETRDLLYRPEQDDAKIVLL